MPHRYDKYMEAFAQRAQEERDRLAKLPAVEHMEIVLDNDATEEEVDKFLHGKFDEDDM